MTRDRRLLAAILVGIATVVIIAQFAEFPVPHVVGAAIGGAIWLLTGQRKAG